MLLNRNISILFFIYVGVELFRFIVKYEENTVVVKLSLVIVNTHIHYFIVILNEPNNSAPGI